MRWKTLLVPHDFSPAAARAFALACELAQLSGGRVLLLHISPIPNGLRRDTKIVPDDGGPPVRIDEHMTSAAKKKLEILLAERCQTGSVCAVASDGDCADVILDEVKEHGADVIVMGTHGRTGMKRLLLGSVAERVIRRADVPVLVVRDPANPEHTHLREEDAVADEEGG